MPKQQGKTQPCLCYYEKRKDIFTSLWNCDGLTQSRQLMENTAVGFIKNLFSFLFVLFICLFCNVFAFLHYVSFYFCKMFHVCNIVLVLKALNIIVWMFNCIIVIIFIISILRSTPAVDLVAILPSLQSQKRPVKPVPLAKHHMYHVVPLEFWRMKSSKMKGRKLVTLP